MTSNSLVTVVVASWGREYTDKFVPSLVGSIVANLPESRLLIGTPEKWRFAAKSSPRIESAVNVEFRNDLPMPNNNDPANKINMWLEMARSLKKNGGDNSNG